VGSVAFSIDGAVVGAEVLDRSESHLVELGRAIDALLGRGGVTAGSIDRVAVVTGPGSFTGLRIGMAYVKGIHAALKTDVVGMTSLELLARQAASAGRCVAPMIDARKDEVYAACYAPADDAPSEHSSRRDESLGAFRYDRTARPRALDPAEFLSVLDVRPTVFVGSGAMRYAAEIERVFGASASAPGDGRHEPDTTLFCRLAAGLSPLGSDEVEALEPFYIRPSDAKLSPLKNLHAYD
jgi:tRNA threonylcarbamoyladenosine biosynthesis protein TsaB